MILNPLLFAYYWLGLSWGDLEWLYFIKTKLFISKNKQQETLHQQQAAGEAKHSAENTINFSKPAASKMQLLHDMQIRDDPKKGLHDVRSFVGACNFYRRHIHNVTYSSAPLTDLIKETTP